MSRENILVVEGVAKSFGGRVALDAASLEVAKGSITGVIGPNGSGKSTLFNIVAGTLRADAGRVLLNGRDISRATPAEICRRGVGRTFQISRLFSELTVLENLVAIAHGKSDIVAVERALALLDFLEIAALRDKWGAELSYGQRKLTEIARALMLEPTLMLLDEPFAGVNPRLQNRIVDRLQALREQGLTLFFIDHEMRIVLEICDDLYVLAEGKVIAHGDAAAIRGDEQVKAAYF
jgi:branched-chain amino acid transport system ATP-binding protein